MLRALDDVDRPERPLLGWLRLAIPTAVAGLLVFGVVVSKRAGLPVQAATLADQSIEWHRQDLPMDVNGPSPDTIQRFFSDKVRFAVRPPVFEQPSAHLVGGRLSNLREHQAAYLIYQVGGRRVSVFIFDASELSPEGMPQREGQRDVLWSRRHGYNVAMVQSGDTGYLVASDLEHRQLVRLINDLR